MDAEPTPEMRREARELHDVVWKALAALPAEQQETVHLHYVDGLRVETYYAVLSLRIDGKIHGVDARPSDAITLALYARAPIFVAPGMLDLPTVVVVALTGLSLRGSCRPTRGLFPASSQPAPQFLPELLVGEITAGADSFARLRQNPSEPAIF